MGIARLTTKPTMEEFLSYCAFKGFYPNEWQVAFLESYFGAPYGKLQVRALSKMVVEFVKYRESKKDVKETTN